jgi:hypothetical protein
MDLIQFFILSLISGFIAVKLNIPAGAMIGPMVVVGVFQAAEWVVIESVPQIIRWGAQSMLGIFIGLQFSKKVLKLSRRELLSFTIVGLSCILTSFLFGWIIAEVTGLEYFTSVIAAVPGSIAEMLMLAHSMHLDIQSVAVLHLLRFILLITVIPYIIVFAVRRIHKKIKSRDVS